MEIFEICKLYVDLGNFSLGNRHIYL